MKTITGRLSKNRFKISSILIFSSTESILIPTSESFNTAIWVEEEVSNSGLKRSLTSKLTFIIKTVCKVHLIDFSALLKLDLLLIRFDMPDGRKLRFVPRIFAYIEGKIYFTMAGLMRVEMKKMELYNTSESNRRQPFERFCIACLLPVKSGCSWSFTAFHFPSLAMPTSPI